MDFKDINLLTLTEISSRAFGGHNLCHKVRRLIQNPGLSAKGDIRLVLQDPWLRVVLGYLGRFLSVGGRARAIKRNPALTLQLYFY